MPEDRIKFRLSPFFLAMPNTKIYNLDGDPVEVCKWTELENMKAYYELFKAHEAAFKA